VVTATEARIPGRAPLREGDEFSVRGQRGRYRLIRYVETDRGQWVDCFGGPDGRGMFRSFAVDRVSRVHRTKVMR
jgi:hypothetical protein